MSEEYKVYMCIVCGFVYDEEKGLPEQNIPPSTKWEDVPDSWLCPECKVDKSQFELVGL